MASLVHQASMPARAMAACDEDLVPQGFSCFGRSLSRASSSSRLEYRALQQQKQPEQGEERRAAQDARSARAKLRWKAVAHEIMAKGGARRRRQQQLAAFSYDSRSYALNFDQGAAE
ncbi:uncharacterized protein LOC120696204 [Panicum virgatum]|uniref:Uncharacterized protein n=1 Tax=Panicum virgatum TaxID=38727 RepID=A0A8T0WCJ4_PANVG|nr:uncharacterized protein LOC120696204 [Panicum virgatum]KAG2646332.1 hypothetical protein PVAP13_2KG503500 [Panicum virgatum]